MKKESTPKHKRFKKQRHPIKKRQPQNPRGSKTKTSDEKEGNLKM
jgi:hypothetical protein